MNPKPKKPKKGITICRVSTAEQATKGASLESQEVWARDKATELGIKIIKTFREGISGEKFPKENLDSILGLVEKEKITHLFVFSLDRLSRSFPYGVMLIQKLWDKGVKIITSTFAPNPNASNDRLQVWLSLLFAEMEYGGIHERTRRGMITKLKKGEYPLPYLPFGCERVDLKIYLRSEYRPLIQIIFETFIQKKSYEATARIVNQKYGKKMDFELKAWNIRKIIKDKTYLGYLSWSTNLFGEGDENKPRKELRAIDERTFDRAQIVAQQISHRHSRNNLLPITPIEDWVDEYGSAFALNHFQNLKVHCPNCDSPILQSNGKEVIIGSLALKYICCKCGHHFRFPSGKQLKRVRNLSPLRCPKCGIADHFERDEKSNPTKSIIFKCLECGYSFSHISSFFPYTKNITSKEIASKNLKQYKENKQTKLDLF
jgi:DNA invertase Pin-like site-specific DNA recombinase/DNA-directed RNA polymerase subunit RPC12/RpoP